MATSSKHHSQVVPGPMETVKHGKEAGGGYMPSSPLYRKQQEIQAQQASALTPMVPADLAKHKTQFMWTFLIQIVLILLVAFVHRRFRQEPDIDKLYMPGGEFYKGFCDCNCAQDWPICLCALLCPIIRWADTVGAEHVQLLPFWAAIFAWLSIEIVIFLLSLYIIGPELASELTIILIFLGVYYRQKLRVLYGHNPYTCKTVCIDCLAWLCCPCCAIVQEAREVEYCRPQTYERNYPPPQGVR